LITVTAVPAVDLLDGVDTTNRPVAVTVPGIRSTPPCRADQALASAAHLVRGKQVRLVASDNQTDPDGRVRARVLLPDGHDYAHAVVSAGAAQPDASLGVVPNQADLAAAEADARQSRRGLWGSSCDAGQPGGNAGPPPPTEQPVDQKTTTTPSPAPTSTEQPAPTTTVTPTPPPDDDVQRNVRVGDPCTPEGAHGITDKGQSVVCTAKAGAPAKWKKA
jgi:hypothetical protein